MVNIEEDDYIDNLLNIQKEADNYKWMYKEFIFLYMMEYYSALRKDEVLPFATTWFGIEGAILSELH